MSRTLYHQPSLRARRARLAAKLRRMRQKMGPEAARHYYLKGRFGPRPPRGFDRRVLERRVWATLAQTLRGQDD
jgi:hypothetical protein